MIESTKFSTNKDSNTFNENAMKTVLQESININAINQLII